MVEEGEDGGAFVFEDKDAGFGFFVGACECCFEEGGVGA